MLHTIILGFWGLFLLFLLIYLAKCIHLLISAGRSYTSTTGVIKIFDINKGSLSFRGTASEAITKFRGAIFLLLGIFLFGAWGLKSCFSGGNPFPSLAPICSTILMFVPFILAGGKILGIAVFFENVFAIIFPGLGIPKSPTTRKTGGYSISRSDDE